MTENQPQTPEQPPRIAGLLAQFDSPEGLVAAAGQVRQRGYRQWDAHSPFPVHGIDRAMGIRPTILPWLVFGGGVAGCVAAMLLQWWTNAVDYPFWISGKPIFSLPANIPVAFELVILFSAFAAFFGVLALNRLPRFWHHVFSSRRFGRATSDGFFIAIDAEDAEFNAVSTRDFLETLGPLAVENCYEPINGREFPKAIYWVGMFAVLVALLPPLWIARSRSVTSESPRIQPEQNMAFQPRYQTQTASALFADRRAMRPKVPGTIAVGQLRTDEHLTQGSIDGKPATSFPMPVTSQAMQRGRERFNIYCACCHGLSGEGDGIVAIRAIERAEPGYVQPRSLHVDAVRSQPVGQIFQTITRGINTMPSYAIQIPVEDRWAIVLYVRALQRSQNARLADVPEAERRALAP